MSSNLKNHFFDRDGVLNDNNDTYVCSPDELHLYDDVIPALELLKAHQSLKIIVTNQPVIARNMVSFDELDQIHAKLDTLLGNHHLKMDATYVCPHHPDKGFQKKIHFIKLIVIAETKNRIA